MGKLTLGFSVPIVLAQDGETMFELLPPATRARVLAAFAGLIILGFGLILLTWLAGRATRRYMNAGRRLGPPFTVLDEDDWAKKPIYPDEEA